MFMAKCVVMHVNQECHLYAVKYPRCEVRISGPQNRMWFNFVATLTVTMSNIWTKCVLY